MMFKVSLTVLDHLGLPASLQGPGGPSSLYLEHFQSSRQRVTRVTVVEIGIEMLRRQNLHY